MKNFIIILFTIIFAGCFANEAVSNSNSKLKCDYYDNITNFRLMIYYGDPYKENITGKVCLSADNKSFVTIKNGLPHGKAKEYNESGWLEQEVNYKNGEPVSGQCANGRTWNNAELSDWKNGLTVTCY